VELVEPLVTVGDGSAASCSAGALEDAAASVNEGGGSIVFDCGPDTHTIVLEQSITFDADAPVVVDGEGSIVLDGGGSVRVIDCDHYVDLTVQRIEIRGGRTAESGAGIHLPWYGALRVVDVRFEDNRCTDDGSDIGGGAFYAGGCEEVVVSGCTFVDNAGSNGGAIDVNGSNMAIVDSEFRGNEAHGEGGGGSGRGGIGGAVYIDGMNREAEQRPFVMCRCRFTGNTAGDHASAVFRYAYAGGSSTIAECEFDDNHVTAVGTGIATLYHETVPLSLTGCSFTNNTTDHHAGALFVTSDAPVAVTNCTFAGNRVPEVGAAIFAAHAPVTVTNCTFVDNHADYGPAIYGEGGNYRIYNSIFAHNAAAGPYNGQSCCLTFDGARNIQWPATRPNGTDDTPCTDDVLFADPRLSDVADNGGFTPTAAIDGESPAAGLGEECPATDQRGEPRSEPCDLGAYEH
jgi:hypothetical protein